VVFDPQVVDPALR